MNHVASPFPTDSLAASKAARLCGAAMPELLRDELLAEIFAETARRSPDARCLVMPGRVWTYAEVDAEAERIARGLVAEGAGPGDVVGLWGPRGPELLIAQIAIARTGAAWLPFDADAPVERIAICLSDAMARIVVVDESFRPRLEGEVSARVTTPERLAGLAGETRVDARAAGATPDHPAYMIYTSGSTGVPKGIVISNRNICHFLRAANEVYGVVADDVMFQGASIAFDLSMEEIWTPYLVGATLFVASPQMMGEADRLPQVLTEAGVTVIDTVPTLLAMLPGDVPSLRVILLGGEALPPAVAQRWSRPGRRIFNTYGPTEATVVATVAEVTPGEPVTIGRPIPNYTCYVVDEQMNLCEPGRQGELLIGGPGVAKGYLDREALTREKFIANPFGGAAGDPVLYRSGDAVSIDEKGDIAFHGRIDDQIKIRGFRVELGEIESKLVDLEGVAQAAVVLRNDDGVDQLVAFLLPEPAQALDSKSLRSSLRERLPPYMVPARYEFIDDLPRLSSGKIDRKALKAATLSVDPHAGEAQEPPRSDTEAVLLDAARRIFPPQAIPFEADFFTDLGGHSLLAARFVSIVRETPSLAAITLQDMYAARTLRALGALLDEKATQSGPSKDLSFTPPSLLRRFLCGLAQAVALPFILALMTAQWLGVFVSYMLIADADAGFFRMVGSLLAIYMGINVATVFTVIAAKWLIIGRLKPGRYPLWGFVYYRWWLGQRLMALAHLKWLQASPVIRWYLRAMGAKIGRDAIISDIELGAPDLIAIGEGVTLGQKAKLDNARVEGADFVIGAITIGDDAYVGSSCVIEEGCVIGAGAELRDLTSLPSGTQVAPGDIWDGSPGRRVGTVDHAALPPMAQASRARRIANAAVYVTMLLVLPPLGLLPIFPAFWVFDRIDDWFGLSDLDRLSYLAALPVMAWPTAFAMVIITVLFIALIRWTILPVVREGTFSIHSPFYVRKWTVALAVEITLETLSSLYATIYMRAWYRLMGAKIGKDAEISTNLAGRYDLVEIGEKCFIADEVVLGDEDIRRGYMTLAHVKTGARVFVGNDGVMPPGAEIPSGALIGIKSKPPANALMSEGDTWFGSPPIKLPVRQRFDGGGALWTYEPPKWKKFLRGVFEAVHISLPTMLFITFGTWAVETFGQDLIDGRYGRVFWMFVASSVAISMALTLVVVAIKWGTMGRYEPVTKPMWSFWAMRTEAVAVMYWGMAGKVFLDHLRGTPFLPWTLRLFGAKFGQGVYMDTTDITEFDCVRVGSFVSINSLAALQTHLYEDRVMKVGRVHVGEGVTIGAGSTVLYDTKVGDYARLGPLTVVMKGEHIPAHSEWIGAPAEPMRHAPAA
ncbi:MAG: amino acid adenylation domain-containing protein [Methylobacteriaceae bacterium]|nr:amino acid adenylation domain-containing protein [Methylobacteriaceae bacterium]